MEGWVEKVPLMTDHYHQTMLDLVAGMRQTTEIYPAQDNILRALELTPFEEVKVVIIGQDPYHGPGQAHGLSFSVVDGVPAPPSLRNIFKEIETDVGGSDNPSTDLTRWATQGVLMLNASLTVEAKKAGSHAELGWHLLTDQIVSQISWEKFNVVFMLWGAFAQSNRQFIASGKHLILEATHPSPFSAHRGFFGCRHFSKCNDYLYCHEIEPIEW